MLVIAILIAALTVFVGGQAGAWRRATVSIAEKYVDLQKFNGNSSVRVNNDLISVITPTIISWLSILLIVLLCASAISGGCATRWYWSLLWMIGVWLLSEAASLLFPEPQSLFYEKRIRKDMERRMQEFRLRSEVSPQSRELCRLLDSLSSSSWS